MQDLARTQYWAQAPADVMGALKSSPQGLTADEAARRLALQPTKKAEHKFGALDVFLNQFKSPIILLLIFAAGLSFYLQEHTDAIVIVTIVMISGLLGFWQEYGALNAVSKLMALVESKVPILRDGKPMEVPPGDVVPGDIVRLSAGSTIPADCILVESKDIFVDEAALTGETFPVEKHAGAVDASAALSQRANCLFMGTHVVSGNGTAMAVAVGDETVFGQISEHLKTKPPESDFERGLAHFGYMLMEVTMILVIAIFAVNVFLHRPVLQSFMFSLALAVGLTPQLLPAIVSINLANGAKRMADARVIVKRLASIESFGSMNVLCSDKTGTITEGVVKLKGTPNIEDKDDPNVLLYAYINASLETGFSNPVDDSIRAMKPEGAGDAKKIDEVPYDFIRKRLSILAETPKGNVLICKGALANVLAACSQVATAKGAVPLESEKARIDELFARYSADGYRVLAVATKPYDATVRRISAGDEQGLVLAGFLIFEDPTKAGIADTIVKLNQLGIRLKIITGDNKAVARAVAERVGFKEPKLLDSAEIGLLQSHALAAKVGDVDVFCEVEPNQKEAIIVALKQAGNVVGYIGDGINDACALRAADVGISVNNAVDVAKESAQLVMLDHELSILIRAVEEGRRTFANTMKYIFMATSANFGNMFSMAGASLFLPFLPLLPKQVLLTNLLTDFPELTIVTDKVDDELVNRPGRWDLGFIRKFMLVFGGLSSIFDYATFGTLMWVLHATPEQFRTGWFMESVISACIIVLVVRTRRPFMKSLPSVALLSTTVLVVIVTALMPFLPTAHALGFAPLPPQFALMLILIILGYVVSAEIAKALFYRYLVKRTQ